MTREIILGNGNMLVCLDKNARIRDFYYPYVGQENHVSSKIHRTGIWVEGQFSWIDEKDWEILIKYKKDCLVSEIYAYNPNLEVELLINEAVHYSKNIFLRRVSVENKSDKKREIRVFFSQNFQISEANIGDTAYYDPMLKSIVNYKGKRYFLIGGQFDGESFTDYATGSSEDLSHNLGTFVDAEDGVLGKNPIEHGSVDSTIGFNLDLESCKKKELDYWIAVGQDHKEVKELQEYILHETPSKLIEDTKAYWISWLDNNEIDFHNLNESIKDLFRRSLLMVRAQTDNHGAIIAANDTHTFRFKEDTYSYMWPRDGALIVRSLDRVGHKDITRRFFEFCSKLIEEDGYLLHKYRPDGSFGSSWHSWLKGDKIQLPIQEDETALLLDSLWKHYIKYGDNEMIKKMYDSFIKKAGDFLLNFRNDNGLPKESYDLWEEKLGVHTFTCSTVYAGLCAAKEFAKEFGTKEDSEKYKQASIEVKEAIVKYLYNNDLNSFVKGIYYDNDGKIHQDTTIDASTFYGLFEYKILDINDPKLVSTVEKTMEKLWSMNKCGGLARYENDRYHRNHELLSNPWIISTLWLAEYYIEKSQNIEDLKSAEKLLKWTTQKALSSGVLSEQLDPITSKLVSVAPLTWSHAGFIISVIKYLDKFENLNKEDD